MARVSSSKAYYPLGITVQRLDLRETLTEQENFVWNKFHFENDRRTTVDINPSKVWKETNNLQKHKTVLQPRYQTGAINFPTWRFCQNERKVGKGSASDCFFHWVMDGNCQTSVPRIRHLSYGLPFIATSALYEQITNCHFFKTCIDRAPFCRRCLQASSAYLPPTLSFTSQLRGGGEGITFMKQTVDLFHSSGFYLIFSYLKLWIEQHSLNISGWKFSFSKSFFFLTFLMWFVLL